MGPLIDARSPPPSTPKTACLYDWIGAPGSARPGSRSLFTCGGTRGIEENIAANAGHVENLAGPFIGGNQEPWEFKAKIGGRLASSEGSTIQRPDGRLTETIRARSGELDEKVGGDGGHICPAAASSSKYAAREHPDLCRRGARLRLSYSSSFAFIFSSSTISSVAPALRPGAARARTVGDDVVIPSPGHKNLLPAPPPLTSFLRGIERYAPIGTSGRPASPGGKSTMRILNPGNVTSASTTSLLAPLCAVWTEVQSIA